MEGKILKNFILATGIWTVTIMVLIAYVSSIIFDEFILLDTYIDETDQFYLEKIKYSKNLVMKCKL